VYFSYSQPVSKAVGFIKYGNKAPLSVTIPVTHDKPEYLRLIISGTDVNI